MSAMIPRPPLAALLLVAFLPASLCHAAQIVDTATGSIVGTAKDATGAVLPSVDITLLGPALMAPRKTSTNAGGQYRFAGLPPGDYKLSFSLPGFTTLEHDVRAGIAFTATVDVTLTLAPQREEAVVTARTSALDRHSATNAQTFDSRELADLPSSRSMAGLLALTHGVSMPEIEVGGGLGILDGSFSSYGRNSSPRHTIEGIVITGLFSTGFTPDYGSFEEVSVHTAAHGAEWPGVGIHTQFVTKSGGNRYTGAIYGAYENRHWQSSNVDANQISRVAPSGGGLSAQQANQLWHYRDVNADAGGFVLKDRLWWYGSIRDQDIASRLVTFPVEPYETRLTNYDGKATYRVAPGNTLVAYGQRVFNHHPHRLDPFGFAGSELSATTAINERADSTADQRNTPWVWKAEWDSVINDALLFDVRVGQFGSELNWKSRSGLPRFEDVETLLVSGGSRDSHVSGRRNQLFGTLNYIKDGWWGSHHLKVGGEALRFVVREAWFSAYPGDMLHVLRSGRPSAVFLFDVPSESANGVWAYSGYASDSWHLKNRLTMTLGVRLDRQRIFQPAQEHAGRRSPAEQFAAVDNLIDWTTVVPRIAAVYDLTDEGTMLAKVSFARYRPAVNASFAANMNPNPPVWWKQYDWSDVNGSGVWEPGEQSLLPRRSRGGASLESVDPALQLPLVNEVGAWIERELGAGIGLRTGGIWRRERFQFARQNINQPFEAFTVPTPLRDPGPDGALGTADDGPTVGAYDLGPDRQPVVNIVRNVPGSSSEYWTWEIVANRRMQDRWSFGAGFTYTWNFDQASVYADQTVRSNPYPLTPNDLINAGAGGRHQFTTWIAKAHGTYETPWGVRVMPVVRHQSGQPFGRTFTTETGQLRYGTVTILAEPVGTRRMDNITVVDVRVEKALRLNGNRRLAVLIDVFNCFNANPEENMIWASGPSFLRPVTIVPPRIARIGLALSW
jgi:hypothetical protein